MLSFANFSHLVTLQITSHTFCLFVRKFFKGILDDSHTLFVLCYSYGFLILITNMAKIQNDVIIRKI